MAAEISRRHAEIRHCRRLRPSESEVVFSAVMSVFCHDQSRQRACNDRGKNREKRASFGASSGDSQTLPIDEVVSPNCSIIAIAERAAKTRSAVTILVCQRRRRCLAR